MAVDWSTGIDAILSAMGESVDYYQRGTYVRSITAVIDRDPPTELGATEVRRKRCMVYVKNDSTDGISSAALDTSRDYLKFAHRIGGTAEKWSLRLVNHDAGMLQLEAQ